jgi:hypothetical protein
MINVFAQFKNKGLEQLLKLDMQRKILLAIFRNTDDESSENACRTIHLNLLETGRYLAHLAGANGKNILEDYRGRTYEYNNISSAKLNEHPNTLFMRIGDNYTIELVSYLESDCYDKIPKEDIEKFGFQKMHTVVVRKDGDVFFALNENGEIYFPEGNYVESYEALIDKIKGAS